MNENRLRPGSARDESNQNLSVSIAPLKRHSKSAEVCCAKYFAECLRYLTCVVFVLCSNGVTDRGIACTSIFVDKAAKFFNICFPCNVQTDSKAES